MDSDKVMTSDTDTGSDKGMSENLGHGLGHGQTSDTRVRSSLGPVRTRMRTSGTYYTARVMNKYV